MACPKNYIVEALTAFELEPACRVVVASNLLSEHVLLMSTTKCIDFRRCEIDVTKGRKLPIGMSVALWGPMERPMETMLHEHKLADAT